MELRHRNGSRVNSFMFRSLAKELKDVEFPWEMCILARAVQNTALKIFWTEIFGKFSVGILVEGDY